MIKSSLKKYLTFHFPKLNLYLLVFIGLVSVVFSLLYIFGIITGKWTFNFANTFQFVILGPLLITIPSFGLIILLSFHHFGKSRKLYYKIIKQYRQIVKFEILRPNEKEREDNAPTLICYYKDNSFRIKYLRDRTMMISLLSDMRHRKVTFLNKRLLNKNIKDKHFNGFGLSTELNRPLSKKTINNIQNTLDNLIKDFLLINK